MIWENFNTWKIQLKRSIKFMSSEDKDEDVIVSSF